MLFFKRWSARKKLRVFLEKITFLESVDGADYLREKVSEVSKELAEKLIEFLRQKLGEKKFLTVFFSAKTNEIYLICEGEWHFLLFRQRDQAYLIYSDNRINRLALERRLLEEIFEGEMISAEIMIQRLRITIWPQTSGKGINF